MPYVSYNRYRNRRRGNRTNRSGIANKVANSLISASRYSRKRRSKYMTKASITKSPSTIIPDRMITKLKYSNYKLYNFVTGAIVSQVYSGNSAYDPDTTGFGQSPEGFDQLAALYGRYRVYASKIRLQFVTTGTTPSTSSFDVVLVPVPNASTGYTSIQDARAAPYAKSFLWNIYDNPVMTHYMGTEKLFGLNRKAVEIDIAYSGTTGSDPQVEWTWQIYSQPADQAANATCRISALITYYTEFYDREPLSMS